MSIISNIVTATAVEQERTHLLMLAPPEEESEASKEIQKKKSSLENEKFLRLKGLYHRRCYGLMFLRSLRA